MAMGIRSKLIAALIAATVLAGCAASRHPAAPLSEAIDEPRLPGDWIAEDPGSDWPYLHILRAEDGPMFEAVVTGNRSWAVLEFYLSTAGDRTIANLRLVAVPKDAAEDFAADVRIAERPWSFAAITLDAGDRLTVFNLQPMLHDEVAGGRLAGVTDGDYDVFIDAGPTEIAALLAGVPDGVIFSNPLAYRRLPPSGGGAE